MKKWPFVSEPWTEAELHFWVQQAPYRLIVQILGLWQLTPGQYRSSNPALWRTTTELNYSLGKVMHDRGSAMLRYGEDREFVLEMLGIGRLLMASNSVDGGAHAWDREFLRTMGGERVWPGVAGVGLLEAMRIGHSAAGSASTCLNGHDSRAAARFMQATEALWGEGEGVHGAAKPLVPRPPIEPSSSDPRIRYRSIVSATLVELKERFGRSQPPDGRVLYALSSENGPLEPSFASLRSLWSQEISDSLTYSQSVSRPLDAVNAASDLVGWTMQRMEGNEHRLRIDQMLKSPTLAYELGMTIRRVLVQGAPASLSKNHIALALGAAAVLTGQSRFVSPDAVLPQAYLPARLRSSVKPRGVTKSELEAEGHLWSLSVQHGRNGARPWEVALARVLVDANDSQVEARVKAIYEESVPPLDGIRLSPQRVSSIVKEAIDGVRVSSKHLT